MWGNSSIFQSEKTQHLISSTESSDLIPFGREWSCPWIYRNLFLEATWRLLTERSSGSRPRSSTYTHNKTCFFKMISNVMFENVFFLEIRHTIFNVLRPTAPKDRIPLGPCSNTVPSALLVDWSQPPKRLLDSNRMTWRQRSRNNVKMPLNCSTAPTSHLLLVYLQQIFFLFICDLGNLWVFAQVIGGGQTPDPSSEDCNGSHWLCGWTKNKLLSYIFAKPRVTQITHNYLGVCF